MTASFQTIGVDGEHVLHVASEGDGRDILLIHGAVTTGQDWLSGPFARVAEIGRAIAVDRPGHGRSTRGRFEGSPHTQARTVRDGLRKGGFNPRIVVGHSFGGLVALAYAELFGDEIDALVLLAPIAFPELRLAEQTLYAPRAVPFWGPLLSDAMAGSLDRPILKLMHKLMFAPGEPPAGWTDTYPWDWMLSGAAGVANGEDAAAIHPLTPEGLIDFAKVRLPVHILHGNADLVIQHERQSSPLAALLPAASHRIVDGAGHMIHHSHQDDVLQAIRLALETGGS